MTPPDRPPVDAARLREIRYRLKEHYNGTATLWSEQDIAYLLDALAAAEQRIGELTAQADEARMGHVRLDECANGHETKGWPLYNRISAKIQKLGEENAERGHIIAALGFEKDELRAKASAAEHRCAAAEYRAQRIVLDAELKARAEQAEAAAETLRAALTKLSADWRKEAAEIEADGDYDCALIRLNDASELEATLEVAALASAPEVPKG